MHKAAAMLALVVVCAVSPFARAQTVAQMSNDFARDREPSVARQTSMFGNTATIVAYIKQTDSGLRNYYASRADDGVITHSGQLPWTNPFHGVNYTVAADPYLYPDQNSSGSYAPRRTYCVGLLTANNNGNSAVVVWLSDDSGRGDWTQPSLVASASGSVMVDKPAITVSEASGSRGYVYVSYTKVTTNANGSKSFNIHVKQSTDGGETWGPEAQVEPSAVAGANASNIVVAPGNGYVYVTWADYVADRIMLARSPGAAVIAGNWVIDRSGPTGDLYGSLNSPDVLQDNTSGQTCPVTRYNWVANRIVVVWHERVNGVARVAIASKGTNGWPLDANGQATKYYLPSSCNVDNYKPAVDFTSNGNLLIAYYSRERNCATHEYDSYYARTNATGSSVVTPPTRVVLSPDYPSLSANNGYSLGEYQEVWCDASTCYSAWSGAPSNSDIYLTVIP